MRSAEEILKSYRDDSKFPNINQVVYSHNDMVEAINEARTEAINEASEAATVHQDTYKMLNGKRNVQMCAVNKQSILSLLNQIQ